MLFEIGGGIWFESQRSAVAFDPLSLIKSNRSAEACKLADFKHKSQKKYLSNLAAKDPKQEERRKELIKEGKAIDQSIYSD